MVLGKDDVEPLRGKGHGARSTGYGYRGDAYVYVYAYEVKVRTILSYLSYQSTYLSYLLYTHVILMLIPNPATSVANFTEVLFSASPGVL